MSTTKTKEIRPPRNIQNLARMNDGNSRGGGWGARRVSPFCFLPTFNSCKNHPAAADCTSPMYADVATSPTTSAQWSLSYATSWGRCRSGAPRRLSSQRQDVLSPRAVLHHHTSLGRNIRSLFFLMYCGTLRNDRMTRVTVTG